MEVEEFLNIYSSVLLDDHKKVILHLYKHIKNFSGVNKFTSIYGTHFALCPWAYDNSTSGPDTCECHTIENYRITLENLIKWYENNVEATSCVRNS